MSDTSSCIFCKIIRGELPCTKVYESKELVAFMDINPMNKGHVLIVPRQHAETLFDLDNSIAEPVFRAMREIGRAIMIATGADGLNVIQNNGEAAWQQVPHVHWHLIPRFRGDGYKPWGQKKYDTLEEMQDLASCIQKQL